MKFLLGAALFLILIYIVAGSAITSVVSVGESASEAAGQKISRSTFRITFKDQWLCYSFSHGDWVMSGHHTGDECHGPFIDSASLCSAMNDVGVKQIRLYWEGRMLECDTPAQGDY